MAPELFNMYVKLIGNIPTKKTKIIFKLKISLFHRFNYVVLCIFIFHLKQKEIINLVFIPCKETTRNNGPVLLFCYTCLFWANSFCLNVLNSTEIINISNCRDFVFSLFFLLFIFKEEFLNTLHFHVFTCKQTYTH